MITPHIWEKLVGDCPVLPTPTPWAPTLCSHGHGQTGFPNPHPILEPLSFLIHSWTQICPFQF